MVQRFLHKSDSRTPAPATFPPASLSASQEARAHLAAARSHFSGAGVDASLNGGNGNSKAALAACFIAISAWRTLAREQSGKTAENLESHLALGELYFLRALSCKEIYSDLALSGGNYLMWAIHSGKANENAIHYWEKALYNFIGQNGADIRAIMRNLHFANHDAAYAYQYAAEYLFNVGHRILFTPSAILALQQGKIGAYGKKVIYHMDECAKYLL